MDLLNPSPLLATSLLFSRERFAFRLAQPRSERPIRKQSTTGSRHFELNCRQVEAEVNYKTSVVLPLYEVPAFKIFRKSVYEFGAKSVRYKQI